jgi:hypothetical protein
MNSQIAQKTDYSRAYYGRDTTILDQPLKMCEFPFKGYFRGIYDSDNPIVYDRKPGWTNRCVNIRPMYQSSTPNLCWETPCSTVFPCSPKDSIDKAQLDVRIHPSCINTSE